MGDSLISFFPILSQFPKVNCDKITGFVEHISPLKSSFLLPRIDNFALEPRTLGLLHKIEAL